MSVGVNCLSIQSNALMDDPPQREGIEPSIVSTYYRFWKGTSWQQFLLSCSTNMPGDPALGYSPPPAVVGRQQERTGTEWRIAQGYRRPEGCPGVYEFGISLSECPGMVVPVYIGKSKNVKNRHNAYAKDGDQLRRYFEQALGNRYILWTRVRYLETDAQAERWEAQFLTRYDYAWNHALNIGKRDITLDAHMLLCCCGGVVRVFDHTRGEASAALVSTRFRSAVQYITGISLLLEILLCIAIICITADRLEIGLTPEGQAVPMLLCYLSTDYTNLAMCTYTYVVCGFGMVFSVLSGLLLLVYLSHRKKQKLIIIISIIFMMVWWMVGAIVISTAMSHANTARLPYASWRSGLEVLLWVSLGVWGTVFSTSVVYLYTSICLGCSPRVFGHNSDYGLDV